jgi:cob(I)alamin adenosyltransferase
MTHKVYTKKGDSGTTSLLSGRRVSKLYPEIRAVGALDELNSFVGLLRTEYKPEGGLLEEIQWDLFNAGSMIINDNNSPITNVTEDDIEVLETVMDGLNNQLPDLKNFILPNGSKAQTYAHICRTVCRRAEIEVLNCLVMENADRVAIITKYLNRLSDFFFVLARYIGHKENINETIWKND